MTIIRSVIRPAALVAAAFVAAAASGIVAQAQEPAPTSNPDAKIVGAATQTPKTPAQLKDQAWTLLSDAVADDKHAESRVQALAALGLMGGNARSIKMIVTAMQDNDVDVRVAAILAAGETRAASTTTPIRGMLDDKEPAVDFIAALTLWKMHDRSGEDILTAVADGDRKTSAKFMSGTTHKINKQLHDPASMAKYGAMQGASMLLGPFGIGLSAFEYLHQNGSDTARISAIEAIAENHTAPIRAELIGATTDKDLGVRAAACKALARYREPDAVKALANEFEDAKMPVRLTAAAEYLISTGAVIGSPVEGQAVTTRAH